VAPNSRTSWVWPFVAFLSKSISPCAPAANIARTRFGLAPWRAQVESINGNPTGEGWHRSPVAFKYGGGKPMTRNNEIAVLCAALF